MLLKDRVKYNLTKKDLDELRDKFPGKNAIIDILDDRKSWNAKNKEWETNNGIHVEFTEIVQTEKGPVEWIYCHNYRSDPKTGAIKPTPLGEVIKDGMNIPTNEVDLLFFMYKCCRMVKNGQNFDDKKGTAYFEFRNNEAKATKKRELKLLESKKESLIWSDEPEGGLSHEKLKQVGLAYNVGDVENIGLNELREAVEMAVDRYDHKDRTGESKKQAFKAFLKLAVDEEEMFAKALCNDLIKRRRITNSTSGNAKSWVVLNPDGEVVKTITKIKPTENVHSQLYNAVKKDEELFNELKEMLELEKAEQTA